MLICPMLICPMLICPMLICPMLVCWAVEALRIWRIAIWPSVRTRPRWHSPGSVSQTGRDTLSFTARSKPTHHRAQRLKAKLRGRAEFVSTY